MAWKVYEYGAATVAVNGGESTVNFGAVLVAPFTTTVNGPAVAFGSVPLLATTLYVKTSSRRRRAAHRAGGGADSEKVGAPEARANVGAGVPVAMNV